MDQEQPKRRRTRTMEFLFPWAFNRNRPRRPSLDRISPWGSGSWGSMRPSDFQMASAQQRSPKVAAAPEEREAPRINPIQRLLTAALLIISLILAGLIAYYLLK